MALEELIVEWSKERPAWQREVMRRIAAGEVLADADYQMLLTSIVTEADCPDPTFTLEHLPQAAEDDAPVRLVEVRQPDHVNALESNEPLTFGLHGVTIVYGDNGSGKSGYARLLKRIARARHQEEVLTDVFRDTALAKPSAVLVVKVGDDEKTLTWPDAGAPELQRMRFYDVDCGQAYVSTESDFPYRPSALFVLDGLIDVCVEIRKRIDVQLAENAASSRPLPNVPQEVASTEAGKLLSTLNGATDVAALDAVIAHNAGASTALEELKGQEVRLHAADTTLERQHLQRQARKLTDVREHIERLNTALAADVFESLTRQRGEVDALDGASRALSNQFASEPVSGVGTVEWRALWEAARRFSEEAAYPNRPFPVVAQNSHCVLCFQPLNNDAQERMGRFEEFVKADIQVRLEEARTRLDREVQRLQGIVAVPNEVTNNLSDLEATHGRLIADTRERLTLFDSAVTTLRKQLASGAIPTAVHVESGSCVASLEEAARVATAAATELADPDGIKRQRDAVGRRIAELEFIGRLVASRQDVVDEIARLKARQRLESAKSAAATTGITKKISELSEESITDVVRDTFTRETEKLKLERVTIARTRAEKGALLHQPKLVGARQQVTLPRVFSEGEQTALGLGAFFTEAQIDGSCSTLILDDPVTSLDHIRRRLVAARLAALAATRQVVVFTHDVAFVADIKKEAGERAVDVTERAIMRSRGEERKPGTCSTTHPWKAKDVPARLNELRQDLAQLKRDASAWSEDVYEDSVGRWAGKLSETWERIFSQEIVGPIVADGGLEVRPMMVRILARFSEADRAEFDGSYGRVSQWATRHDKSSLLNYVAPDVSDLEKELTLVETWFKRVKAYKA
jgi:energy-coupling factor transporter ATP-binding protein EcfA2